MWGLVKRISGTSWHRQCPSNLCVQKWGFGSGRSWDAESWKQGPLEVVTWVDPEAELLPHLLLFPPPWCKQFSLAEPSSITFCFGASQWWTEPPAGAGLENCSSKLWVSGAASQCREADSAPPSPCTVPLGEVRCEHLRILSLVSVLCCILLLTLFSFPFSYKYAGQEFITLCKPSVTSVHVYLKHNLNPL